MLPTEIVPRCEQGEHCFMVLPLLRERIRQACEASVLHSDRQIVTLDVRRAVWPRSDLPRFW